MGVESILKKVDDVRWLLPESYKSGMRVPGLIYADREILKGLEKEQVYEQVANVATLPGIVGYSYGMPDIHWGYGFPIGGVAAMRVEDGVISPGGVGYDISCGVRLLISQLEKKDIESKIELLINRLFAAIPCGVGEKGRIRLKPDELDDVLYKGAHWAVEMGYGDKRDLQCIEEGGRMKGANPDKVSKKAKERGAPQLGTLGSGNHFLEVQYVEEVYLEDVANKWGLRKNIVTVMVHCGSRGLGHQVCDDYVRVMRNKMKAYGISVPDAQLACVPIKSKEGEDYFQAMAAATNYAFANREVITHWVREVFYNTFGSDAHLRLLYDVSHNIAHIEKHRWNNKEIEVCVHRKGATRAFGPGSSYIPEMYRDVGQPVIIPGSMGTPSYVLLGTKRAEEEAFASTCHGAGRVMSRHAAVRDLKGKDLTEELEEMGIKVKAREKGTLYEEAPEAYKDIDKVVDIVDRAGLSKKVVRLKPIGVIKG